MLPTDPAVLKKRYQQALADLQTGRVAKAEAELTALAGLLPKVAEIPFQLYRIAETRGDTDASLAYLESALALKPDEPVLLSAAATAFAAAGLPDKALAAHDALIQRDPKAIKPRADKGHYLQSLGRFAEAEAIFRTLLKKLPESGELYRMLIAGTKVDADDPLIKSMKRAWVNPKLPKVERMHLGFALGKAMEDIGAHGQVFSYLRTANEIQAKAYPFDPEDRDQEVEAVLAAQDGPLDPVGDTTGRAPIFVTGMPRSGTTLVEQIIASHSQAEARGELATNLRLAYHMFGPMLSAKPLSRMTDSDLDAFARAYRQQAERGLGPDVRAFTDKSIQSHLILGLLYRAFPNARFIVVHRDPRDIAVSVYKNHFRVGTHRYSNELRHIARYIKSFQRAVAHWRDRLPDRFHEVHYEALVTDPEAQSRALVAAAGLPWEDSCLDFHKAGGAVKTLSLHQVRQPITASRAQAWRRYEAELAPFIEEWEKN